MKISLILLITLLSFPLFAQSAPDPLKLFTKGLTNTSLYSSDQILQLELDLQNNGQKEVLLSLARDINGRAGNVWSVYANNGDGYQYVGGMEFNFRNFYVGSINELGQYGLVNFYPSGAGEGSLNAFVFDGKNIQERDVAKIERDPQSGKLKNSQLLEKYLGLKKLSGDSIGKILNVSEIAGKYGLRVATQSYSEALKNGQISGTEAAPVQQLPPTNAVDLQTSSPPSNPSSATSPPSSSSMSQTGIPMWVYGIILLSICLIGGVWYRFRPK